MIMKIYVYTFGICIVISHDLQLKFNGII
jgi:hypothetical protein